MKMKTIADFYFSIRKKGSELLEKNIEKDLEKSKRHFLKQYKITPTEDEIREFKKDIVMKKGIMFFAILLILLIAIMKTLRGI